MMIEVGHPGPWGRIRTEVHQIRAARVNSVRARVITGSGNARVRSGRLMRPQGETGHAEE